MVTTIYTFSIKNSGTDPDPDPDPDTDPNDIPTISNNINDPIDLPKIPANVSETELQKRFILDIMKDGNASDIHITDNNVYRTFSTKAYEHDHVEANYMGNLKKIEKDMEEYIGKGIDFPGLIKKSTDQSNKGTKIMKTKEIFFESGANEQSVCIIDDEPGIYKAERICTPAATLDSASKGTCVRYFPTKYPLVPAPQIRTVVFDKLFCKRFGFPKGFTWSASNIDDKEDEFIVSFNCDAIGVDAISGNVRWGGNFKGNPFFVLGNKEKNKKINSIMNKMDTTNTPANVERSKQIFRLLLMKELGDVMQVFMYYAYVMIKRYENAATNALDIKNELHKDVPIEDNAMLTVDSVVYLLCRILSLPCVYTGARAGVVSGQAFYKLYTPIAMTNAAVYLHIKQSLKNMYTNIQTSNNTNITHLTAIRVGLSEPDRSTTGTLKWYFFFIKKSDTTASATKQQWIEETMSAFANYKGTIEQYNVSDTIIEKIIANVNTLIKAIEASNIALSKEKDKLEQEYEAGNLSVSQASSSSSSSSVGDPPWPNWETTEASNQGDKIKIQREFINNKLATIGNLNEYRSEEHVTALKKNSFIVNCAKTILCKGLEPYSVRPKKIPISADSIIDINTEVNNKLDDVVKAITAKFGVPTSGLNINAGMDKSGQTSGETSGEASDETSDPKYQKVDAISSPRGSNRGPKPGDAAPSATTPPTTPPPHDVAATTPPTVATPPTDASSPSNASSQSDASPSDDSSQPEKMAVVDEVDETQPGESQPLGNSPPLGISQSQEDEAKDEEMGLLPDVADAGPSADQPMEGVTADSPDVTYAAPSDAPPPPPPPAPPAPPANNPPATIVPVDQLVEGVTADSPADFLDLYNIDKNIYFLSKFLYDMIDIDDIIEFTSINDIIDDDIIEFNSTDDLTKIPDFTDIPQVIHNILLRKYYYSTNKDDYNELFEILTRLGEEPITTIMQVRKLHNACTKYIEDTTAKFKNIDTKFKAQNIGKQIPEDKKRSIAIDGTDVLYININDDMHEWPQPVSAPPPPPASASASASLVVSPVKGDALTKKKNKQRKKNKQSRKKGNVKNKRSRKITQHKKIKYSKRKKHDNSKQSKRKKHKDKRGIK